MLAMIMESQLPELRDGQRKEQRIRKALDAQIIVLCLDKYKLLGLINQVNRSRSMPGTK
jgi:hypothetical protein